MGFPTRSLVWRVYQFRHPGTLFHSRVVTASGGAAPRGALPSPTWGAEYRQAPDGRQVAKQNLRRQRALVPRPPRD